MKLCKDCCEDSIWYDGNLLCCQMRLLIKLNKEVLEKKLEQLEIFERRKIENSLKEFLYSKTKLGA